MVSKSNMPFPPEMAMDIVDAMTEWARKNTTSGKFEQVWSFAEGQGGGAIVNVKSLEELSSIMTEYPFSPFTDNEVHGLVDLQGALQNMKQVI